MVAGQQTDARPLVLDVDYGQSVRTEAGIFDSLAGVQQSRAESLSIVVDEAARSVQLAARQRLQRIVHTDDTFLALGHCCHQQNARLLARLVAQAQGKIDGVGARGRLQRAAPHLQQHGHRESSPTE